MRIKLVISYDGSPFFGWQKTRTGPSVQEALETALARILSEQIEVEAASRTDRGVHAKGQVVSFLLTRPLKRSLSALAHSLNAVLVPEIRVLSAEEVEESFHPTLHATGKEYHYLICNAPVQLPMLRLYSWHLPKPLDILSMESAAADFLGVQDFSAFTNLKVDDAVRKVDRISVRPLGQGLIRLEIEADRFLYKMARNLVGTIVQRASGKLTAAVSELIALRDRTKAGMTAPAHGLSLMNVFYGKAL